MLVDTVADALRVIDDLGNPAEVGITVDLGHCVAVEPEGVVGALRQAVPLLRNVQIDYMLPGVHEHLELGAGALNLTAAIETLREVGYTGVAAVELPRHSHDAPRLARTSREAWVAAGRVARHPWVAQAVTAVTEDPARAPRLFAEAGRRVGRTALEFDDPHGYAGSTDDDARAAIIAALHDRGAEPTLLRELYDHGDDA